MSTVPRLPPQSQSAHVWAWAGLSSYTEPSARQTRGGSRVLSVLPRLVRGSQELPWNQTPCECVCMCVCMRERAREKWGLSDSDPDLSTDQGRALRGAQWLSPQGPEAATQRPGTPSAHQARGTRTHAAAPEPCWAAGGPSPAPCVRASGGSR